VHFIGIGGVGMSGLARLLLARGIRVTGSDVKETETTEALRREGAQVLIGHRVDNLGEPDRVVYSAAIGKANPELAEARRRGIPAVVRAELLGEVMRDRIGIAIAGTHGKTTTTAMVASIFLRAGADPSILIGGDWAPIGSNARAGRGRFFIAEACEAFDSFLELHPHIAVVTNIEADHLDWHKSEEGVVEAFRRFLGQMDAAGCAIVGRDDLRVQRLLPTIPARVLTFGLEDGAELTARDLDPDRGLPRFTVLWRRSVLGEVRLNVPGRHNVLNALAALGVALEVGLPFSAAREALAEFSGVGRRFERLGLERGVLVIDDYAHHPTEIAATLAAARAALDRRLIAVFQPHLYSRTQLLLPQFARAFRDADQVIITEIYPAREKPIPGIDGRLVAEEIARADPRRPVTFIGGPADLLDYLLERARPGDAVLTMGAGDIREVGENLVRALHEPAKDRIEVAV
jgi:UDP-N-acetylmuramate--alanine ligase